jgi:uncharacterized integral membrane protein (TIGR00698 family)
LIKKYLNFKNTFFNLIPGVIVATLIALSAQFLSNNYQVPAMLMSLLIGMTLHFLGEEGRCVKGLSFSSKKLLQLGIILLGARISVDLILSLDLTTLLIITLAVILTIIFGIIILKIFGHSWKFGVLVGGAVAICGVSAAMAISAVLPKDKQSNEQLTFVVLGVTLLSTMAMIIYPILVNLLSMNERNAGIFLGSTIHDVAQVIGAGFSVSELTGETATLIKLYRVTLLFPIVLLVSFFVKRIDHKNKKNLKTPFVPMFIVLFVICALANSFNLIPDYLKFYLAGLSKWCLLIAIAAVGTQTRLQNLKIIGLIPAFLLITTSLFIMIVILILI